MSTIRMVWVTQLSAGCITSASDTMFFKPIQLLFKFIYMKLFNSIKKAGLLLCTGAVFFSACNKPEYKKSPQ